MREGLPPEVPAIVLERAEALAEAVALSASELSGQLEFSTYNCAAVVPPALVGELGVEKDLVKAVVRRALRTRLKSAWPERRYEPERPEVIVTARCGEAPVAELAALPVYVAGRYMKHARGLSQTVFYCRRCRGKGRLRGATCSRCRGSGRFVEESVEDFVRPVIERAMQGRGSSFHGAGREDVDVRMLGTGRPFVVTVESPRLRSVDAAAVIAAVAEASGGRVTVADLVVVDRAVRRQITSEHGEKVYMVEVRAVGGALPEGAAALLAPLSGATLSQRTPQRVEARRADKVRERRVRELEVIESSADRLLLRLTTDPGLYVKEFVSGDDGRTVPSVAGALGIACLCTELDVVAVR